MTDLLSTLQLVLKDGGYQCWLMPLERRTGVTFEDDAFMGFGYIFDSPQSLIERWQAQEAATLNRFASRFRDANEKAWNIYSVFLCSPRLMTSRHASSGRSRKHRPNAQNRGVWRRDRRGGRHGDLPIMPLQYRPTLEQEDAARLRRRIADFAPDAADAALNEDVPAADVIALLGAKS